VRDEPRIVGVSVVIPNWNGRRWLPECLTAISAQTQAPRQVIVVDNGSTDDSVAWLRAEHPDVLVIVLGWNTGFANAANAGVRAAAGEFVALVNSDVQLAPDWLERVARTLGADPGVAAVATKILSLRDPEEVDDAGDVLRRDGACEQRGRFHRDDGSFDQPGEVFGACAGAALYRRDAVLGVGGFDRRLFAYLEDVDVALRLRLAGWRCRYEPVVALHAGGGSGSALSFGHLYLVQRNTLALVARYFPLRWLPLVAYRQLSWGWHALREGRLRIHLRATVAALPLMLAALRGRRAIRSAASVPIEQVVPPRPFRGRHAGGSRAAIRASWR
jgi:GT2 family glycosyltransferase